MYLALDCLLWSITGGWCSPGIKKECIFVLKLILFLCFGVGIVIGWSYAILGICSDHNNTCIFLTIFLPMVILAAVFLITVCNCLLYNKWKSARNDEDAQRMADIELSQVDSENTKIGSV